MTTDTRVGITPTSIKTSDDGKTRITYHSTDIMTFDSDTITLNTGGWFTNTTKTRMNQASSQFALRFGVFQKNWDWFIEVYPSGEVVPFPENGRATIDRHTMEVTA